MKIIVANWKMNCGFDQIDDWIEGYYKIYSSNLEQKKDLEIVLCPQAILLDYIDTEMIEDGFHFLEYIGDKQNRTFDDFDAEEVVKFVYESRPLTLGAQDCGIENEGQYTGDISAKLLKEVNCKYVILGHSERRNYHAETNEIVLKKATCAINNKIIPIICVGESLEIRQENKHFAFIREQILKSVPLIKSKKLVIAYEPIWAIGSGTPANSAQIAEIADFIHKIIKNDVPNLFDEFCLLYGGSVNSKNSAEILAINGIDGLLVGKASTDIEEFGKIIQS
jgi:triosephosphate isomerase